MVRFFKLYIHIYISNLNGRLNHGASCQTRIKKTLALGCVFISLKKKKLLLLLSFFIAWRPNRCETKGALSRRLRFFVSRRFSFIFKSGFWKILEVFFPSSEEKDGRDAHRQGVKALCLKMGCAVAFKSTCLLFGTRVCFGWQSPGWYLLIVILYFITCVTV